MLVGHQVFTVAYMKWIGMKNGELLRAAEAAEFDLLITSDQGFPHQQDLAGKHLAVLLLSTPDWNVIRRQVARIAAAIDVAQPGSLVKLDLGRAPEVR